MPISPGLNDMKQKMSNIKNNLGNLKIDPIISSKIKKIKLLFLFPVLLTVFLVVLRPSFILKDDYTNLNEDNQIDFKKVTIFFLLCQVPLFLSIFLNF